jgi:hypothetical protein
MKHPGHVGRHDPLPCSRHATRRIGDPESGLNASSFPPSAREAGSDAHQALQPTANKLRLLVPSSLRSSAAAELVRSAAGCDISTILVPARF